MSHPPVLPAAIQAVSIAVLVLFLGWVVRLIRRQALTLRDSLLWLLTTLAALVLTAAPSLLVAAARAVGVQVPSNALFGAGLLYLAVNVLSVTIALSAAQTRVRRVAQECALLRAELDELRARVGAAPPPP